MSDSRVSFDMVARFMSDFEDELDAHSYPVTTEELVSAHGELTLTDGTETFGETIRRLGEQTFADPEEVRERLLAEPSDPEEVRLATYSVLSADAVGRVGYSDRDAPGIGEVGYDQVSF